MGESQVKDWWVSILLLIGWLLTLAWVILRKRKLASVNAAGILLLASEMKTPLAPTGFIFEEEGAALRPSQSSDHVSDMKQKGEHRKLRHRERTFKKFCNAENERDPPNPYGQFQVRYRTKFRMAIYQKLGKSALKNCGLFVSFTGLLATTCTWWLRAADDLAREFGLERVFNYETVLMNMKAAHEIHAVMLPLASFILALYINQKLTWFFNIIELTWTVQGKLHDMAMFFGGVLLPRDDPFVLKARWMLYRYLNLVHFYLYTACGSRYQDITTEDLRLAGLVTREEGQMLDKADSKRILVLTWLGTLMSQISNAGYVHAAVLQESLVCHRDLRSASSMLMKELTKNPPISFAQLMQLMIDMLLLLTAPSMTYVFDTSLNSYTVYLWPAFGAMVVSLFYQGGMRIITAMEYPFGRGVDHLDPDFLLMSSERAMYQYLTSPVCSPLLDKSLGVSDQDPCVESLGGTGDVKVISRMSSKSDAKVLDESAALVSPKSANGQSVVAVLPGNPQ